MQTEYWAPTREENITEILFDLKILPLLPSLPLLTSFNRRREHRNNIYHIFLSRGCFTEAEHSDYPQSVNINVLSCYKIVLAIFMKLFILIRK